jgi:hypothetical protein
MAEQAGFGFNPNAFGLSAAGQEGSGMNQILPQYDAAKFDKAIVAAGEKEKEDKTKQKDIVKPKIDFTDIKKGWQGYFVEEGITLDEKQRDLAKKSVDWQVRYIGLDPKAADYESKTTEMLKEYSDIEYEIQSINFTADQMLQNKEIIDKSTNSLTLNGDKYDLEASADLARYVKNLPTEEQTRYLQNNILNVPKINFDWNKNFLTPTGYYIKTMFEQTIGSPITGATTDDNGNFVYLTDKKEKVPFGELKTTLEALLTDTVATTTGLYEYLLGRKTADGKSYAQLAAEANYDNGNVASFVKYLMENQTEEFVKQVIPLGDQITTQQILQPYNGDGGTNVVVNMHGGTPTTTKGGTTRQSGIQGLANATTLSPKEVYTGKNIAVPSPDFILYNGDVIDGSEYTLTANTSYTPFIAPYVSNMPLSISNPLKFMGVKEGHPIMEKVANKLYAYAEINPELLKYLKVGAYVMANAESGQSEGQGYWKINNMPIISDNVRRQYSNNAIKISNKWGLAYKPSKYPKISGTNSGYTTALTLASQFPDKDFDLMLQSFEKLLKENNSVSEAYNILYNDYSGATSGGEKNGVLD